MIQTPSVEQEVAMNIDYKVSFQEFDILQQRFSLAYVTVHYQHLKCLETN